MPLDEPSWWYGAPHSRMARVLRPVARLYSWMAVRRLSAQQPYRSRLPVICVGNFTAGGTGKTPLTLEIARRLKAMGENPVILTRGYGGRTAGPHWVVPQHDTARDVGDEPLLLARAAPTLIARDRRAGAIAIETSAAGHTVIVMDDGLQNPSLTKDLTFAVIDARRGLGNGEVIPAGPLRAPIEAQLALVDAILVNSPSTRSATDGEAIARLRREFPGPALGAGISVEGDTTWISQTPLLAFAGIANPERFFLLLQSYGGRLAETRVFKDHHAFKNSELRDLHERARSIGAQLVTTEKDYVRLLACMDEAHRLADSVRILPIRLDLEDIDSARLDALLEGTLRTGGYRGGH